MAGRGEQKTRGCRNFPCRREFSISRTAGVPLSYHRFMKILRNSWIALLTMGAALAVEPPAEEKPVPVTPAPSGDETPAKPPEDGQDKKQRGPREGKGGGRKAMEEMWKKADTDGDGFLSPEEFAAMDRPGRLPDEKRAEIFKRIDKNGDGRIGPDEIPKGRPGGMPPLEQVDFNKDGKIEFSEFQKLDFVARLPEERQRALFTRMDQDGDGFLTPKDRPQRDGRRDGKGGGPDGKGPRHGSPLDMIKDFDKDGDGALSFAEFREIPWMKDKGEDEQEDRFEEMDKNHDQKLDAADFPPPPEAAPAGKPEDKKPEKTEP